MSSYNNIVIYALKCDHAITAPATLVNGELMCPWHEARSEIIDVIEYEWRAKCTTCNYTRWSGLVKQTAETFANGHLRRNVGHHVQVEFTKNPVSKRTREKFIEWRLIKSRGAALNAAVSRDRNSQSTGSGN